MLKRTIITLSLTAALIVVAQPLRTVHGILMTDVELTMSSADNPTSGLAQKQDERGNSFLNALKAPFKAIGRLFGRGRKDHRIERMAEKDIKKFQSTPVDQTGGPSELQAAERNNPSAALDAGVVSHLENGRALLNTGQLNEAIAELSLATSMEANPAGAYNLLGVAYKSKGLTQMARNSFERALKIAANDAQTLNNLGYLLYTMSDFRGALEPLKRAAHLAPDDAQILNNLAMTQSQLGKFDDAAKNFVRAGGEIIGRLNIAKRLELAGRTEEALKNFEAAKASAEAQQKANPTAQSITVVMEIRNGRVSFASVPKHRSGMEDYEASALRVARYRRYPASKNGQESIVVRVSPIPGS